MNRTQALRLAIRSLEYMHARYHLDAEDVYGTDSPKHKAALRQTQEIAQAIAILKQELNAMITSPHTEVKL